MTATTEQLPLFARQPCHACGAKSGCRCHANDIHAPRLFDPDKSDKAPT